MKLFGEPGHASEHEHRARGETGPPTGASEASDHGVEEEQRRRSHGGSEEKKKKQSVANVSRGVKRREGDCGSEQG